MTINNSGGVAKYDGQPMPKKPTSQFNESIDDIFEENELPVKVYPSKNTETNWDPYNNPIIKELMDASGLSADEIMNGDPEMVRERLGIRNSFGEDGYWNGGQYIRFVTDAEREAIKNRWCKNKPAEKK